jgi:uncharacterized membrane protein YkgB
MNEQTIIWSIFCLVALALALWQPRLTRRLLGGFFVLMALGVNVSLALRDPAWFVHLGTDSPLLPVYAWGFAHLVAVAPAAFGIAIAAYEVLVGVLMMAGGPRSRWGLAGGILFLVLSAPLSSWTVPNLILAAALAAILLREPRPGGRRAVADAGVRTASRTTVRPESVA